MMLSLLVVLTLPIAVFAYIGRASIPARERIPITSWRFNDLFRNFFRGLDLCSANTPLRSALDGLIENRPTKYR